MNHTKHHQATKSLLEEEYLFIRLNPINKTHIVCVLNLHPNLLIICVDGTNFTTTVEYYFISNIGQFFDQDIIAHSL